MKAITLKSAGGVENLVLEALEVPTLGSNEVLVQVKAISINPVDAFVRGNEEVLNKYLQLQPGESPVIIGWDISGVVTKTGTSVSKFKEGDEVFGMVKFPGHGKAYAEYVAAPASHLALKPENISHEEAAAATLAALTAWQGLVTYGKVQKNDKVLIDAAGGGVGHYAIQIAKHFGAYVIGIASDAKKELVLGLGADEHLDYNRIKFEGQVKDADLVLDSHFDADHLSRSIDATKTGGRIISLLAFFEGELAEKAKAKDLYTKRMSVVSSGEDMEALAGLLQSGALQSHVSATFPFDEMSKAHEQVSTGKTAGKIVVTL